MSFQERLPAKVMPVESLMHWVSAWKLQSLKVVFTNGVFDILHRGHIDYLMKAADLGDRLVIGLNADSSVKMLNKGINRPIQDQDSRAFILSSMAFVNAITIFNEETPEKLIELVSPDILVKGGDYQIAQIAGSDHVLKHGGQVVTIPLVEGYSTSAIESRIKSS
jgi:rfaE bifunctional protein nucleotidyltransferase chain/domain